MSSKGPEEQKQAPSTDGVTRGDFLNSTLLASGAMLLDQLTPAQLLAQRPAQSSDDFTGYGGVGDYANSNGNTEAILKAGHGIRDGAYDRLKNVVETQEVFDCVVAGGGISGLAAALLFQRETGKKLTTLVLENHPIFGGEAKQNEFDVDGQRLTAHQGSAVFWLLRGARFGRIAFANTDLAGIMDHRTSITEADRAVRQLLDQVLT